MLCGGSIGLQADTVTLASGMPLEFPAPPSLQILAIARYRCGLRLVWHENPSLLFVPPRMKHYTSAAWPQLPAYRHERRHIARDGATRDPSAPMPASPRQ